MAEEKTEEKSGGSKKTLFIIIGGVVLIAGVAVGAYFAGSKIGGGDNGEKAVAQAAVKDANVKGDELGPLVPMEDFIINIMDDQGSRYLKASITMEMSNPTVVDEVQRRAPQIRDAVLLLMGSKTFDEIRDLQGKLQLRSEIIARVNEFLHDGKVNNIYFTDFVVQ